MKPRLTLLDSTLPSVTGVDKIDARCRSSTRGKGESRD